MVSWPNANLRPSLGTDRSIFAYLLKSLFSLLLGMSTCVRYLLPPSLRQRPQGNFGQSHCESRARCPSACVHAPAKSKAQVRIQPRLFVSCRLRLILAKPAIHVAIS
ncbi:unnamed protein product [Durusdinium trenchii]|uniref:Uncharacterized protein n=1 Tax=Durusdinium trenchii TaxID=1381693 RepID=A0ABP0NKD9_9DINO